jgi:hypothetical protein
LNSGLDLTGIAYNKRRQAVAPSMRVYPFRLYVNDGGLLFYGADIIDPGQADLPHPALGQDFTP